MNWIDASDSSQNIARFAFSDETMVLTVEFRNGGRYEYYDVPRQVFEGMQAAASKGQFLAHNIKGRYRYART